MAYYSVLPVLLFLCLSVGCVLAANLIKDGDVKQPSKTFTKPRYMYFNEAYNPDSAVASLLAGMFVKRNGIERSPHIDFKHTKRFQGQQMDSHKFTHKQKVQFGLESENESDLQRRRRRNFMTQDGALWPEGIVPYDIDSSLTPDALEVIFAGINMISDLTCVRFARQGTATAKNVLHGNWVRFFSGKGCWSYVGMVGWGRQDISLQDPGCINVATAIHEMCHAIGMWHEQNRRDRDHYIQLYGDNIQNGGLQNINFAAMTTRMLYPYDISSVLQYSLNSFAIDRSKPTIRSKDPRLAFLAGKAQGLMYYDAREITTAYQCTKDCNNPPSCENGGYVNHACHCHCPSPLTGSNCSSVKSSQGCGGVINLEADGERTITSSNYPNNYRVGEVCVWLVKAPSDRHIQLTIDFMDVSDNGYDTCYHWLEIRYNLMGQDGPELCGLRKAERIYTTADELKNVMILRFNTAVSSDRPSSQGFHLTLKSVGVSCVDHPCVFGKCIDTHTSYWCDCQNGFSGTNCDQIVNGNMNFIANFDDRGMIILQNEATDTFDWSLNSDGTPTSNTGPSYAHSGKYYMYIESSSPRAPGDTAILSTGFVRFATAQERCLKFFYHMYGSTVGSLKVFYKGINISKTVAFSRSGNQGNNWIKAKIDIPAVQNLQIGFEGMRGSGYRGDIAIDSIELLSHSCSSTTTTTTTMEPTTVTTVGVTTTTNESTPTNNTTSPKNVQAVLYDTTSESYEETTPTIINDLSTGLYSYLNTTTYKTTTTGIPIPPIVQCGFENGNSCFMENMVQNSNPLGGEVQINADLQKDDFDWTIGHVGPTSSSETGPSAAYSGSRYAFIEASNPRIQGDRAILKTNIKFRETMQCLGFSYHMYGTGKGMGTLSVFYTGSNGTLSKIFKQTGNQGDAWKRTAIQIAPTSGLQIYFEGICGSSYRSDIAIDDVIVSEGICGCAIEPCRHGGTCIPGGTSGYTCTCEGGYGGHNCELLVHSVTCTFNDGMCSFLKQSTDDGADWVFGRSTHSIHTGPQFPLDGVFAYTESSFKRRGTTYILTTAGTQLANQNWCLSFYYNMYGSNMGALVIRAGSSGDTLPYKVYLYGNRGLQWFLQKVTIPPSPRLVIEVLVIRGLGYRSDIAIDNVSLAPGVC
ncbi:MAM and LDL-receptor class A domain-containing protein 1-like [Saccostrea cucullata]|uniref:MAM and LDL-receptor class A domain-containing protein 1-like n=1 Tax=Saccostrea cuccullata TaxID=36930 RepID=UPI002ED27473